MHAALTLALALLQAPAGRQVITVSPGGPVPTITRAIAMAQPGARIVVRAGTYREPVIVVDRRVEIAGEGWPVIDAAGAHEGLLVRADSVVLRGLVVRNVGTSFTEDRAGIRLENVRDCVVEDNRLLDTFFGIYAAKSSGCLLRGNEIRGHAETETSSGNAIHLWASRNFTIVGNRVSGHRDGVYFEFVRGTLVQGNTSNANVRYGLHFMFSDSCAYEDNIFRENGAGVAVMYARDVRITGNQFAINRGTAAYGLLLKEITDSRVAGNTFTGNSVGLQVESSNRITAVENQFESNGWAIRITASSEGGVFRDNTFLGNSFDVATNSRTSHSTFAGNYWDQYAGYDLDHDGYGDVPYHPVRLFSLIVSRHEPGLILLRSFFVDLLDAAERVMPVLTPETLVDSHPRMRRPS